MCRRRSRSLAFHLPGAGWAVTRLRSRQESEGTDPRCCSRSAGRTVAALVRTVSGLTSPIVGSDVVLLSARSGKYLAFNRLRALLWRAASPGRPAVRGKQREGPGRPGRLHGRVEESSPLAGSGSARSRHGAPTRDARACLRVGCGAPNPPRLRRRCGRGRPSWRQPSGEERRRGG